LGDEPQPTFEATLREARQLVQESKAPEAAIAKYRAVVETHMENEKLFTEALKGLADCYERAGQTEEGIRFFMQHVDGMERSGRRDVLKGIFNNYRLKHEDAVRKVYEEMQGSAEERPVNPLAHSSQELSEAILQRGDKQLREKALEKLKDMLAPESPETVKQQALSTLSSSLSAKFERAPFLSLVRPLLKSDAPVVRALALGCLAGLEANADDLPLAMALGDDPSPQVRMQVAAALIGLGNGEHGDQVIPVLMKLLQDPEEKVVERSIRSMWGQYSSPEYDEFLIKLSRDPRFHYNTIYHCLSTMPEKSVAVCRRLVEELDEPDWNSSGRAAWGLTYGVTDEAKGLVEDGLLKALPEETNSYTRQQEFRALRRVASEKSRVYLTSVIESETETEGFQQLAREILADMGKK
jgi:HEAT repeat protein